MRIKLNWKMFQRIKIKLSDFKFFDVGYRQSVRTVPTGIKYSVWKRRFTKLVLRPQLSSVAVTPAVEAYANKFCTTEKGIVDMIDDLSKVKFVDVPLRRAIKLYGMQTANDVIVTRKIPAVLAKGEPDFGCGTLIDAVIAALKAKNIEAWHIRTTRHSVAEFKFGNRWFVADPFKGGHHFLRAENAEPFMGSEVVSQVGEKLRARIKTLENSGYWRRGTCLKDHVKSFYEFDILHR